MAILDNTAQKENFAKHAYSNFNKHSIKDSEIKEIYEFIEKQEYISFNGVPNRLNKNLEYTSFLGIEDEKFVLINSTTERNPSKQTICDTLSYYYDNIKDVRKDETLSKEENIENLYNSFKSGYKISADQVAKQSLGVLIFKKDDEERMVKYEQGYLTPSEVIM